MDKIRAEVDYDDQHGPIVRVHVGDVAVAVYLGYETGVVNNAGRCYGIEVTGPWHKMPNLQPASGRQS